MKFEVESVFVLSGRSPAFVAARRLGSDEFAVTEESTLGGIPLKKFLEMPRKLREDGTQDRDAFVFCLKESSDSKRFAPGQIVVLVE